jgi:hypothetical protein
MYKFILLFFLISFNAYSQGFEKVYSPEGGSSFVQTPDSGFIITIPAQNNWTTPDGFLKVNKSGDSSSFIPSTLFYERIIHSYDFGYIVINNQSQRLARLNNLLDTVWTAQLPIADAITGLIEMPDSSIIISALRYAHAGSCETRVHRFDKNGVYQWISWGMQNDCSNEYICATDTLIYSVVLSYGWSDHMEIIQYSLASGDSLWAKHYMDSVTHTTPYSPWEITATSSALYICGGYFMSTPVSMDQLIMKANLNGDTLWTRKYSYGFFNNIISAPDGKLYCTAFNFSDSLILCAIDSSGNLLWSKKYKMLHGTSASDLIYTNDNHLAVLGIAKDTIANKYYTYLLKTDTTGIIQTNSFLPIIPKKTFSFDYRSTENEIHFSNDFGLNDYEVVVYNISGVEVLKRKFSSDHGTLKTDQLQIGKYIVVIRDSFNYESAYNFTKALFSQY